MKQQPLVEQASHTGFSRSNLTLRTMENSQGTPQKTTTRIGFLAGFRNYFTKTNMKTKALILLSAAVLGVILAVIYTAITDQVQAKDVERALREIQNQEMELELALAQNLSIQREKQAELDVLNGDESAILEKLKSLDEQKKELMNGGVLPTAEAAMFDGNFVPTMGSGIDEFLKVNGAEFVKEAGDSFRAAEKLYGIKAELLVCVAQADSSLGKALKSTNNIGNVGNNDRGNTVHYETLGLAIAAMGQTLNNQYLGSYSTIGQLSRGGGNKTGKVYATSEFNWNKNVKACLQNIYQDPTISESWGFRI